MNNSSKHVSGLALCLARTVLVARNSHSRKVGNRRWLKSPRGPGESGQVEGTKFDKRRMGKGRREGQQLAEGTKWPLENAASYSFVLLDHVVQVQLQLRNITACAEDNLLVSQLEYQGLAFQLG